MNLYIKVENKWYVEDTKQLRYLIWYEWIELYYLRFRNWFHLLGKEK